MNDGRHMTERTQDVRLALVEQAVVNIKDDIGEIKTRTAGIAETVALLARIEERQISDGKSVDRAFEEIRKIIDRVTIIEKAQPVQRLTSGWVLLIVQIVLTAVISVVVASGVKGQQKEMAPIHAKAKPLINGE